MSAIPKHDDHNVISELPQPKGPGARLKAAREARKLGLDEVAEQLRLKPAMLILLEADDYEHLPTRVFVQGYMKNYARFIGIPEEAILQALNNFFPAEEITPVPHISIETSASFEPGAGTSRTLISFMSWFIVLGLGILFLISWRGYLENPEQTTSVVDQFLPSSTTSSATDGQFQVSVPAAVVSEQSEPVLPERMKPAAVVSVSGISVPENIVDNAAGVHEAPIPDSGVSATEQNPVSSNMQAATVPVVIPEKEISVTDKVAPKVAPAVLAAPVVTVSFSEDCWVDIRDATRKFRVFGVRKAGSSITLNGEPPFKILLGNASAAKIVINGENFDLSPFTKANVAKFVLESSDISN